MDQGTAKYGITEFAQMTVEEFAKHQTGLKMKPRVRKFKSQEKKLRFKKEIPDSWDWTEHGVVTEVKNQVITCEILWDLTLLGHVWLVLGIFNHWKYRRCLGQANRGVD